MMRYETIATFAMADKAKASDLRDRLLAEGRMVWLELNADPELTVSVREDVAANGPESMTPGQEQATQQWIEYMRRCGVGSGT